MTAHFWLIDTTGNFCDNEGGEEGQDNCYITLGEGYNQAPYSLVSLFFLNT